MAKARDYADWTAQIEKDSGTINVFGLSKQTLKKRVSVPPQYINKMRLAVEKQLTHELYKWVQTWIARFLEPIFNFRYNEDVEGAIVSFDAKSMRPLQSTTSLQNSPGDAYLHFSIKVDIVLFAPKPSMYLTGVCTEVSKEKKSRSWVTTSIVDYRQLYQLSRVWYFQLYNLAHRQRGQTTRDGLDVRHWRSD